MTHQPVIALLILVNFVSMSVVRSANSLAPSCQMASAVWKADMSVVPVPLPVSQSLFIFVTWYRCIDKDV
jgi:hypothetical protein